MANVELIYDGDCPNVANARANLLRAFAEAKHPARWVEWKRSDPASPPHVRGYGSPTVLVDGRDVAGVEPSRDVTCCRLYTSVSSESSGAPPVEILTSAMRATGASAAERGPGRTANGAGSLAVLPGVGAALLPVGLCPACWPAYAGLLGALGLGFLLQTAYLLPATAMFLLIAVGALAFRVGSRRGYGPFLVGLPASAAILVGKFVLESDATMYSGIILLVAASIWNAWPRKAAESGDGACPACAPEGQAAHWSKRGVIMNAKRKIEVFSAGCPACDETLQLVNRVACPSCEVSVLDMNDAQVAARAKSLGIRTVPAVVVDGKLAECCSGAGPDEAGLRAAGVGQAIG